MNQKESVISQARPLWVADASGAAVLCGARRRGVVGRGLPLESEARGWVRTTGDVRGAGAARDARG